MTPQELKQLEAQLEKRGYKKWTTYLTSSESWSWFKSLDTERDEDGTATDGYQIAFRVWDYTKYGQTDVNSYGFDFWASPISSDYRMDFTANWEPICDFDIFEAMAKNFYELTKKYRHYARD